MQDPASHAQNDAFARLQQAERECASSRHNSKREPTPAMAEAGNYAKGRLQLHGLNIVIENPARSERSGVSESGKAWTNRMGAAYGEVSGTRGADGDPVDVFIGPFPESQQAWVINQGWPDGGFDEHKIVLGAPTEQMARDLYMGSFDRGWNGLQSIVPASVDQIRWWLKNGDLSRPFTLNTLPFLDGTTTMNKTFWNAEAQPIGIAMPNLMYALRTEDQGGLLLDSVNLADLLADPDIERVSQLDALVVPVARMSLRMDQLKRVMDAASSVLSVTDYTISDPIRSRGVMQVAVMFALSDGQAITVWFHNPDTTPAKITPLDELVSWKWMLNKKDITITVAPERGKELNPREVARRIMRLAERNSEKFKAANAKLAEKTQTIAALDEEIAGLETRLGEVQGQITEARLRKDVEAENAAKGMTQAEKDAYITSAAGYATIKDDENELRKWQDVLDAFFQERFIAIRNALRELGWEGEPYQPLRKGGAKFQIDSVFAGASNVVGATYRVKNEMGGEVGNVVDSLESTPADVAFALDAMLLTMPQPEAVEEPTGVLPDGWSESRPGGMATKADPLTGGIVDRNDDGWFVIMNNKEVPNAEKFANRAAAFAYVEHELAKLKPATQQTTSPTRSGTADEQAAADAALAMAAGVVADMGGTFEAENFSAPGTIGAWSYGKAEFGRHTIRLAASGGGVVQVNGRPFDPAGNVITTPEQVRAAILEIAPPEVVEPAPAVERADNPAGLSDAEMVVLITTVAYKPAYRATNAIRETGISLAEYQKATSSLNDAGRYLRRSAITPAGRALVDGFKVGGAIGNSGKLSAFKGRFGAPDEDQLAAPSAVEEVDAAYRFGSASDAFKEAIAWSVGKDDYSPFKSAMVIDKAATAEGMAVAWDMASESALDGVSHARAELLIALDTVENNAPIHEAEGNHEQAELSRATAASIREALEVLDAAAEDEKPADDAPPKDDEAKSEKDDEPAPQDDDKPADEPKGEDEKPADDEPSAKSEEDDAPKKKDGEPEDDEDDDTDPEKEWEATPESDKKEEVLDGDFPGHPFRGNQYRKAGKSSSAAVETSMRAKYQERKGDAKSQASAHKAAHHAHKAASIGAKGKAKKYHEKMAKFHGSRAGGAVLDGVAVLDAVPKGDAEGTITKGGLVVGRVGLALGDGKAMVFVGPQGGERSIPGMGMTEDVDELTSLVKVLARRVDESAVDPDAEIVEAVVASLKAGEQPITRTEPGLAEFTVAYAGDEMLLDAGLRSKIEAALGEPLVEKTIAGRSINMIALVPASATKVSDAFADQINRARDDAIRWANKEKDQYGADWMRENLPAYLVSRWGISLERATAAVNEWFPNQGDPVPNAIDWTKAEEVNNSLTDLAHFGEVTINDVGSENVYFLKDGKPYFTKLLNTDDYTPGQTADFTGLRPGEEPSPADEQAPSGGVDPQQAADRDYLQSLVDGRGDLMASDVFERLEPMFAKYETDADMMALLESAAQAYGDAAYAAAQKALAPA